ncbi:MAG: exosortase/archaeosortase family protein [Candidatus Krumholzibacteria bacterium]|nr:exosortase/archaeosortase family protein [Candidatus Krumholzibacteria bacterium]
MNPMGGALQRLRAAEGASLVSASEIDRSPGARRLDAALLAAACVLFAALYAPVVPGLFRQWLDDENYRHGLLIPLISALVLWRRRGELRAAPAGGGTAAGAALLALAAVLLIGGTAAAELFTTRLSLPLYLLGAVLAIRGAHTARIAAPPILFLLLMVPLPYIIYYKITFPMQLLSARLSAGALDAIGVSVARRGNILTVPGYTLEVVAACSGLRSLMTMFTLALVFALLTGLSWKRKAVLALCAAPVAIAANTIRLVVTALGAWAIGPEFADGPLHEASGLIVFAAGFLLLALCLGILTWTRPRRNGSQRSPS